ncbi:MAG: hypothetical protein ACXWPG_09970, partial [Ktedonobacteraceae bacterium]
GKLNRPLIGMLAPGQRIPYFSSRSIDLDCFIYKQFFHNTYYIQSFLIKIQATCKPLTITII